MKAIASIGSAAVLLFVMYFVTLTDSCSMPVGWRPPTTIEQMSWGDMVLYGKVLKTYPHRSYRTAYTAKMEVYCILRGQPVPRIVNITRAGYIDGMCTEIQLLPGRVYLAQVTNRLQAQSGSVTFKDPGQIEEALKACNLNPPTYPLGVDESTAVVQCPAGLPAGECEEE